MGADYEQSNKFGSRAGLATAMGRTGTGMPKPSRGYEG